jgi:predicted GNAT family acetyltransferase
MEPKCEFNPQAKKIFITENGKEAFIQYVEVDSNTINYTHTYVPPELRGRGIAAKLVEAALIRARLDGKKVTASCSYVQSYLQSHPEFQDLAI